MISLIIAAALVALIQIAATRGGSASPITAAGTSVAWGLQEGVSAAAGGVRGFFLSMLAVPSLTRQNRALAQANAQLQSENARLQEQLAAYRAQSAIAPLAAQYARSVRARVIGYPPEGGVASVTIDKGTRDGIRAGDGVIDATGVVGRIVETGPLVSKAQLVTDFSSTVPAIVQSSRAWGVARGNLTSLRLEYISQDAPLKAGDLVVTGEARSFHSGVPLGTIVSIDRTGNGLYQRAVLKPSANLGSLDRVLVVTQ